MLRSRPSSSEATNSAGKAGQDREQQLSAWFLVTVATGVCVSADSATYMAKLPV